MEEKLSSTSVEEVEEKIFLRFGDRIEQQLRRVGWCWLRSYRPDCSVPPCIQAGPTINIFPIPKRP